MGCAPVCPSVGRGGSGHRAAGVLSPFSPAPLNPDLGSVLQIPNIAKNLQAVVLNKRTAMPFAFGNTGISQLALRTTKPDSVSHSVLHQAKPHRGNPRCRGETSLRHHRSSTSPLRSAAMSRSRPLGGAARPAWDGAALGTRRGHAWVRRGCPAYKRPPGAENRRAESGCVLLAPPCRD